MLRWLAVVTSMVTRPVEVERLCGFALHRLGEHRNLREQGADVAHDDAGLLPVGSNHSNRGSFALLQELAVIAEAGEINGVRP